MLTLRLFDKRKKPPPVAPLPPPERESDGMYSAELSGRYCRLKKTNEMAVIKWQFGERIGVNTVTSQRYVSLNVDEIALV